MILLLDFRIGEDTSYQSPGNKEGEKDKDDDTKSSKVFMLMMHFTFGHRQNETWQPFMLQDPNNDATSRKGDEEEGSADVRKIPIGKRLFEFYDAPFTKFWFNTVSSAEVLEKIKSFKIFYVN